MLNRRLKWASLLEMGPMSKRLNRGTELGLMSKRLNRGMELGLMSKRLNRGMELGLLLRLQYELLY